MNPKIIKLKAERAKNDEKIAALRSRNRELDESIVELENTDIIGLARATGMSMEEIGREFSGRDHSTIVYSLKVMSKSIQTDTRLRETVEDIIKNVRT